MVSTKQREAASKRLRTIEEQLAQLIQEGAERKERELELLSLVRQIASERGRRDESPSQRQVGAVSGANFSTDSVPKPPRRPSFSGMVVSHPVAEGDDDNNTRGVLDGGGGDAFDVSGAEDGPAPISNGPDGDGTFSPKEREVPVPQLRRMAGGESQSPKPITASTPTPTPPMPPSLPQHQQPEKPVSLFSQFLQRNANQLNLNFARVGTAGNGGGGARAMAESHRRSNPNPLFGSGRSPSLNPTAMIPPPTTPPPIDTTSTPPVVAVISPRHGSVGAYNLPSHKNGGGIRSADASQTPSQSFMTVPGAGGRSPNTSMMLLPGESVGPNGASGRGRKRTKIVSLPKTSNKRRLEDGKTLRVCGYTLHSLDAESWVVALADVAFVFAAVIASIFAVTAIDPDVNMVEDNDSSLSHTPRPSYVALYAVIQILSACWVGMRFFVRTRTDKWTIVDNLQSIRSQYLRSWFVFDLIYTLPIELVFVGWFNEGFYYSLPRHILRFLRFGSLIPSVNPLTSYRRWFRFLAYVAVMIFVAHCCAHVFLAVTRSNETGAATTLTYVDGLYWTVATLTSVGYGDMPIESEHARIVAVFVMAIGVVLISTFTALATDFLTTEDSLTNNENAKKNHMAAMLALYNIPWELQRDVIHVFPSIIGNDTERQFRESVEVMPPFIRERLMLYFNAHHLKQVSLFGDVAARRPELLLEVTKTMQQRMYAPYEFIVQRGDTGDEMYIILNGTVDVSKPSDDNENEDILLATLSRGDWFGEQAILTDNCVRSADIVTVSTVEVLVLAKGPMMVVLKKCPDILDRLINASNRRTAQNNRMSKMTSSKDPSAGFSGMTNSAFLLGSESSPEFKLMGHNSGSEHNQHQHKDGDGIGYTDTTTNGATANGDELPPPVVAIGGEDGDNDTYPTFPPVLNIDHHTNPLSCGESPA